MAPGPDGFPTTPLSVVEYLPLGRFGRKFAALFLVGGFFVTLAIGAATSYWFPMLFSLFWLVGSLFWLVGVWLILQFARVEVDREARTLTVVRVRWPLPELRRSFPLDAVRDAIVQATRGSRGSVYSVALVVEGEPRPVPLLFGTSGRGPKDKAASEIQQLIQSRGPGT